MIHPENNTELHNGTSSRFSPPLLPLKGGKGLKVFKGVSLLLVFTVLLLSGCAKRVELPPFEEEVEVPLREEVRRPAIKEAVDIRVLVLENLKNLTVKRDSPRGDLYIRYLKRNSVSINGKERSLPRSVTTGEGPTIVNGRPYTGRVELIDTGGKIGVVNELGLERYVVGLINNEISSKWPEEAIKAQAVIARTYALYKKKERSGYPYDLKGTVLGQVYRGSSTEDMAALRAVRKSRGEVLTYDDSLALTVYHSNAGGVTEAASNVWGGRPVPYLRSVQSPTDSDGSRYYWKYSIGAAKLRDVLRSGGYNTATPYAIEVLDRTSSGRIKRIRIKGDDDMTFTISGKKFRSILGYSNLRSTLFRVQRRGGTFIFTGKGSGHGVGLSQWGAKGMADGGRSYRRILSHYYPGTKLQRAY